MKGYNYWSYSPYKPILKDAGNPYICRIVPSENAIHFEWLEKLGADTYHNSNYITFHKINNFRNL